MTTRRQKTEKGKFQAPNHKKQTIPKLKNSNPKRYDLEERTLNFSKNVRMLVKQLKKTIGNIEDSKQLIRSSGSVGANYREANESLSKKDFAHRIKICRKEAKESEYWLNLVDTEDDEKLELQRRDLQNEALELVKIFNAILQKAS